MRHMPDKTVATPGRRVIELAPDLTAAFVQELLHRAIAGFGPFPSAALAAGQHLRDHDGDPAAAVHAVIETHVRYAAAQGFVTNVGGLLTVPVALPANLCGLALIQCRMIAIIGRIRGYDLADPRTRNGILACLLGEDAVDRLVAARALPAPPMALATAPAHDPELPRLVAAEVAADLISRVAGKRLATTVGRRIPLAGGLVGAGVDGYATWKVGRYADLELLPRRTR